MNFRATLGKIKCLLNPIDPTKSHLETLAVSNALSTTNPNPFFGNVANKCSFSFDAIGQGSRSSNPKLINYSYKYYAGRGGSLLDNNKHIVKSAGINNEVTAVSDKGYVFKAWQSWPEGIFHSSNVTLNTKDIKMDRSYIAVFEKEEDVVTNQVTISPNPATDMITISGAVGQQVNIKNQEGKTVLQTIVISNDDIINVSFLPNGTYQVKTGNQTQELIISK